MTQITTTTPWDVLTSDEAMDLLSNAIMIADNDNIIRFINKAAERLFRELESELRVGLPHFNCNDIVGKNVDVFHKNPAHQQRLLAGLSHPHDAGFKIGRARLAFKATPLFNDGREKVGVLVEWVDKTVEDSLISEMERMSTAHDEGRLDVFVDSSQFTGEYATVVESLNGMVKGYINDIRKVVDCVGEFGVGNFEAPLQQLPGDKAFINDAVENLRSNIVSVTGEIASLSEAIVAGRLDTAVEVDKYQGDFKSIMEAFENAFVGLNSAFQQMSSGVEQITVTADRMSEAAQTMAANSEVQSTSVEEVSSSIGLLQSVACRL